MEKAHKMQEKKKSISGRKTDKTGKPAIWQLRGRGFYAGNEKEEKNLQSVILDMVNRFGYLGILILIAVENVFPPIPSEVILTFGGFLTTCTRLHPAGVVLASTAGSLLGALVLYGAGTLVSPEGLAELLESRPMKLLGFRAEDAWKTIAWFQKKGQRAQDAQSPHPVHRAGLPGRVRPPRRQIRSSDRPGISGRRSLAASAGGCSISGGIPTRGGTD